MSQIHTNPLWNLPAGRESGVLEIIPQISKGEGRK